MNFTARRDASSRWPERAPIHRRERLLKLARLGLKLAHAQLRDPSLRPDVSLTLSADQHRAIAEFLLANPETKKKGRWFAELVEIAERCDWPSCAVAPFRVLIRSDRTRSYTAMPIAKHRSPDLKWSFATRPAKDGDRRCDRTLQPDRILLRRNYLGARTGRPRTQEGDREGLGARTLSC
jgi:hypothetical protein